MALPCNDQIMPNKSYCCFNSNNITTKFVQLHYFYHKHWGTKDAVSYLVQKFIPPWNSVPDSPVKTMHVNTDQSSPTWWKYRSSLSVAVACYHCGIASNIKYAFTSQVIPTEGLKNNIKLLCFDESKCKSIDEI